MPVIVTIRSRLLEMIYDFIDNLLVCKQKIELEGANGHLALCAEVAVDVVDVLKIHVHLIVMPLQSLVKLLGLLPLHFFLRAIGLWHQLRIKNETEPLLDGLDARGRGGSRLLRLASRLLILLHGGRRRLPWNQRTEIHF